MSRTDRIGTAFVRNSRRVARAVETRARRYWIRGKRFVAPYRSLGWQGEIEPRIGLEHWEPAAERCRLEAHLLEFRADEIPHSGRTFRDHALGVARMLDAFGQPWPVQAAGMFHSIYCYRGPEHAPVRAENGRTRLRQLIGRDAEALVFLFATVEPAHRRRGPGIHGDVVLNRWTSRTRCLRPDTKALLALLDFANSGEQKRALGGWPAPWIHRWSSVRDLTPWLEVVPSVLSGRSLVFSQADELRSIDLYRRACDIASEDPDRALELLAECRSTNPHVGEPFIVAAEVSRSLDRDRQAAGLASEGASILQQWGTPWDKRFLLEQWLDRARLVGA